MLTVPNFSATGYGFGANVWFIAGPSVLINISGSFKITYNFGILNPGTVYFQIYKNGVILSPERSTSSGIINYQETYSFIKDDLITFKCKVSTFNAMASNNPAVIINYFYFKTTEIYFPILIL